SARARGNPQAKGDKVEPAFLSVLGAPSPVIPEPPPGARTSGRRRVLADWIASPDNPLTARVLANRVWQHHFGRGIVRSPNNFGTPGDRPTHPELLDWLAAELVAPSPQPLPPAAGEGGFRAPLSPGGRGVGGEGGWRLKPLHRLIVTSNAYRMSSRGDPAGLAA